MKEIPLTIYVVSRDNKYNKRRFYTSLKWARTMVTRYKKRYDDVHLVQYTRDVELRCETI